MDPNGPQSTFASESFIDGAAKADPLEFRLRSSRPAPLTTRDSSAIGLLRS